MADEISGSQFAPGDERGKTREETNCNKDAANSFDNSCEPKQRTELNGLAAEPAKDFLAAGKNNTPAMIRNRASA